MIPVLDSLIGIIMNKLVDEGIKNIAAILNVESDMVALKRNVDRIRVVLDQAETKKIESNPLAFRWLAELREVLYDTEDLMDDFAYAQRRNSKSVKDILLSLSGLSKIQKVLTKNKISSRIRNINSNLSGFVQFYSTSILSLTSMATLPNADEKVSSRNNDTCSFQLDSEIVGIDNDATDLVDRITRDSDRKHSVFAITGMCGIGKTTLARKVFNNKLIKKHFDNTVWLYVSRNPNRKDLLKEIIRSIEKDYSESRVSKNELFSKLIEVVKQKDYSENELSSKLIEVVKKKRVFIVLDDIWNSHFWEEYLRVPLHTEAKHSRILITTRNQQVAMKMNAAHTHPMTNMLQSDGWSMLCKIVFEEKDKGYMNELADVGKQIVDRCKGLPLVIKEVGGVLRMTEKTKHDWRGVLNSKTSMQDLPKDILPSFLLSYEDLPSHLRQCFIYCSLFPQDFTFYQAILRYMWIAEGFIQKKETNKEESAKEYYKELVMRNILQVTLDSKGISKCKMHDLLHSLAIFVSQNQYIYVDPKTFGSSDSIRRRHLRLNVENMNVDPKEREYVRTLMLSTNTKIVEIPDELLSGLRRLRVLDLEGIKIETLPEDLEGRIIKRLPDSVGKMRQLRFLSISASELHMLPDSIENLENLETLMIASVLKSHSLPKGIGKLRNLRHLLVSDRLQNMPNGLDNLKKLRVLDCFVVNECTSSSTSRRGVWRRKKSEDCKPNMKELKDLSELTDLSIHNLERVGSKEEAEEAAIEMKTSLKCLTLSCQPPPRISDADIRKIEEVFKGIKIPENLTELSTDGFFGKQLPSLGNMPELVNLHISGCPKLKSLGEGLSHATCLKKMTVIDLSELVSIENLSSISELKISSNPSLRSVKNLPSLKKMNIENCKALAEVKDVGERSSLSISSDEEMTTQPTWSTNATDSEIVQPTVTDSEEIVPREENGILISEHVEVKINDAKVDRNFPGASEIGHDSDSEEFVLREENGLTTLWM